MNKLVDSLKLSSNINSNIMISRRLWYDGDIFDPITSQTIAPDLYYTFNFRVFIWEPSKDYSTFFDMK